MDTAKNDKLISDFQKNESKMFLRLLQRRPQREDAKLQTSSEYSLSLFCEL